MITIPIILLECKKVFSNASYLITLLQNSLKKILLELLSTKIFNTNRSFLSKI